MRIRVLHVITRLVVGGAQENTLLTARHLDRARYDVTLASGYATGPEGSLEDSLPRDIVFERIPELCREPSPIMDALALRRLHQLMRRYQYHIVHTHTTKAGILGRVAARVAGVPVIIHTPHGHAFDGYVNRVGSEGLKVVERWLTRWTDRIICLTEAEREDCLRFRIGSPDNFEVIHSGVDIDRFRQARPDPVAKRQELGLPPTGPLVGYVGRLAAVKGGSVLLDAASRIRSAVPDATLVFVGDGPLRPELERRAARLHLNGAVMFLGLRRDVADILPLFEVVAVPSLNEGMGRVAVQAMAAGRPIVGSRVCGIQDVIADGQTGLLVPPGDPDALARSVIQCLTNPDLSTRLGRNAQAGIHNYGIAPMVAKIDSLYTRCAQARHLS